MDNKNREQNRKTIPYILVDSPTANIRHSNISPSSSEESIPVDAPLARQSSGSIDIDTVPTEMRATVVANGIDKRTSDYSENARESQELKESVQDIT